MAAAGPRLGSRARSIGENKVQYSRALCERIERTVTEQDEFERMQSVRLAFA